VYSSLIDLNKLVVYFSWNVIDQQSLVDESGRDAIDTVAQKSADALARGDGAQSTQFWSDTEDVGAEVTGGVNVYNILDWNGAEMLKKKLRQSEGEFLTLLYSCLV